MWNRFLVPGLVLVSLGLFGTGLVGCTQSAESDDASSNAASTPETMAASINQLTAGEQEDGWMLLFDGQSMDAWRGYQMDAMPDDWTIDTVNGANTLHFTGAADDEADDIITKEMFGDFELRLEWRISPAGNSGIMYHVREEAESPWQTGPEIQILDDDRHPDAEDPTHRAGALYDMIAPDTSKKELKPVGEWNSVRLIVENGHAEHWLNGAKIVDYPVDGEEWTQMIAESKFADLPLFGTFQSGHICLQDHSDKVWYRNIKIRRLDEES